MNLIEYSKNWEKNNDSIITAEIKNKILIFVGKEPFKQLVEKIKEIKCTFYISDPTPILMEISNWEKKKKIEAKILKNMIFILIIKEKKKNITIKNITNILGENINNICAKMGLKYNFIPYWTVTINSGEFNLIWEKKFKNWLEEQNIEEIEKIEKKEIEKDQIIYLMKENITSTKIIYNEYNKRLQIISKDWYKKISIGSISINIFKKYFNIFEIKIENSIELDKVLRSSYFGGRCEVFGNQFENMENVYHMDYRNMYGEMLKLEFPTGKLKFKKNPKNFEKEGFYFIKGYSDIKIPVLPHKGKIDKESPLEEDLIFSNGEIEGLFYKEEIELFLEYGGTVKEIKHAYIFEGEKLHLFKNFSEFITEKRKNDNFIIWKKLIVSFYGRLGMSSYDNEFKIIETKEYENFEKKKKIISETWVNGLCIIEYEKKKKKINSLVQYASITTARARIKLYKTLIQVEKEEGRILYCDTDSVFAAFKKDKNMENTKIEWEKEEIEEAVFASTRCYSLKFKKKWETKIAGNSRNIINFEDFKKNFYSIIPKAYSIYNYKESIKNLKNWRTWKEFRILDLHSYKKRKFTSDKKKTKNLIKIKENYI